MAVDPTEIPTAYTNRAIDLARAAEGEADNIVSELDNISRKVIRDIEAVFGTKQRPLVARDLQYMKDGIMPAIERYYGQALPEALLKIQKEIIAKELNWNTQLFENARNPEANISPRVSQLTHDLSKYDLENAYYRVEGTQRHFTQDTNFINPDIYKAAKRGDDAVENAGKYFLPKQGKMGIADLRNDSALKNQFTAWLRSDKSPVDFVKWTSEGDLAGEEALKTFELYAKQNGLVFDGVKSQTYSWTNTGDGMTKPVISIATESVNSALPFLSAITPETIKTYVEIADAIPFQGKTFIDHMKVLYPRRYDKLQTSLTNGFNEGLSVQQMTSRIKNDVLGSMNNETKTLVRSFFMHNAVSAKDIVYNSNPDLIEAIIWNSTLDARTTPMICGIRDGKWYSQFLKKPIGHDLPWGQGPARMHWNCRSSSYPKLFGIDSHMNRPTVSAGENYKRGDKWNSKGKVRKNKKDLRDDGIIKTPQQKGGTYEDWLRKQPLAMQQDVLGVARAKAFRDGGPLGKLGGGNSGGGPTRGRKPAGPKPKPPTTKTKKPTLGRKPRTDSPEEKKMVKKKTSPKINKPKTVDVDEVRTVRPSSPKPTTAKDAHTKLWDSTDATIKKTWPKLPKEYVPFKNVNDAAAYAEKHGFAQHVDFGKLHPDIVNEMNAAMHQHVQDFPVFKGRMSFLGSTKVTNQLQYEERLRAQVESYLKKVSDAKAIGTDHFGNFAGETDETARQYFSKKIIKSRLGTEVASAMPKNHGTQWDALTWNDKFAEEKTWEKIKDLKKASFANGHIKDNRGVSHWPVIDDPTSFRFIMDHELGHQLDYLMGTRNEPRILDLYNEGMKDVSVFYPSGAPAGKVKKMEIDLSTYSTDRKDAPASEMIAEAWAEYRGSKTPRPYAKEIGELMLSKYKANY